MKTQLVRMTFLMVMVLGLAVGTEVTTPVRAQEEPLPGSIEITLGEQATMVAKVMVQVPVTVTCTMPSVPWETGPFGSNASVTVRISQAVKKNVVSGETALYNLQAECDGTPHTIVAEIIGDAPFKNGEAVVSAFGGVSFVAWEPQYIELGASDSTGNQVIRLKG
jgi:hypothetical protein